MARLLDHNVYESTELAQLRHHATRTKNTWRHGSRDAEWPSEPTWVNRKSIEFRNVYFRKRKKNTYVLIICQCVLLFFFYREVGKGDSKPHRFVQNTLDAFGGRMLIRHVTSGRMPTRQGNRSRYTCSGKSFWITFQRWKFTTLKNSVIVNKELVNISGQASSIANETCRTLIIQTKDIRNMNCNEKEPKYCVFFQQPTSLFSQVFFQYEFVSYIYVS